MMKLLLNVTINLICTALTAFFLLFAQNYIPIIVMGSWKFDFRDWIYTCREEKSIELILMALLMTEMIIVLIKVAEIWVRTFIQLLVYLTMSFVIVIWANHIWTNYILWNFFSGDSSSDLNYSILELYGSIEKMQLCILTALLLSVVIGIICAKLYLFVPIGKSRFAMQQVILYNRTNIEILLAMLVISCMIWPCMYFFVYKLGLRFTWIWSGIIMVTAGCFLGTIYCDWKTLSHYYDEVNVADSKILVLVNEKQDTGGSVYYNKMFLNQNFMKLLGENGIDIIPFEVCENSSLNDYVSVDIVGLTESLQIIHKKANIPEIWKSRRGAFKIVLDENNVLLKKGNDEYDVIAEDISSLVKAILKVKEVVIFHTNKKKVMDDLDILSGNEESCVIEELLAFKNVVRETDDIFECFDLGVKWMENLNFIYTLKLLQILHISVQDINERIKNATFGTWGNIREKPPKDTIVEQNIHAYSEYSKVMNMEVNENIVVELDKILCKVGIKETSGQMSGNKMTVNQLLEYLNKVRNYTRGHGAYTFKFDSNLNMAIISVLAFLIKHMSENNILNFDQKEMEKLGWVICYGGNLYFCYSYSENRNDGTVHNYLYNSLSKDTVIRLPENAVGE